MTHYIAMIPYANMAPFQEMGPPEGCAMVDCLPRESIQALKFKHVWAAAVPVGGLAYLEEETEFVGHFGIAVMQEAMSVLFFSDRPFETFSPNLTIGLTGESASSVRLLYLLLGYQNEFEAMPHLVPEGETSNGYLVIGDRALSWAREYQQQGEVRGYRYVVDLAALWYERFRLPFVFARWVVRKDTPAHVKDSLHYWLEQFKGRENNLIQEAAPKVAERLQLPLEYAQNYLKVIRRCLSSEDDAGQARFQNELKQHAKEPLFPRRGPGPAMSG
jgi:predicted solute-binding protein